jgi:predicted enzyme involved in methoxymalonyl-ACP biosynthesis
VRLWRVSSDPDLTHSYLFLYSSNFFVLVLLKVCFKDSTKQKEEREQPKKIFEIFDEFLKKLRLIIRKKMRDNADNDLYV